MTLDLTKALQGSFSFYKDPEVALENYNEFGFHIEKDLIDANYCDQLVDSAYTLPNAKVQDFRPAMMPHKENDSFVHALKDRKVVDVIAKMINGVPMGLQSQFFYCNSGTRGFSLHQDSFFVQARMGVFVSAWLALVDVTTTKAALIIYPGSHKEGLLPVRKLNLDVDPNQDRNANNEETVVPEKYNACNVPVSKGSVVFIHSHVVHGSNANTTSDSRYVLLNTYIKEGEDFRRGNYAQREPMALS